jgi:Lrp/AsnC ligand binding domain
VKQRFFVFVECAVGHAHAVARSIKAASLPFATEVSLVSGKWDILVRSECDNDRDVGQLLVFPLQSISGVTRTKTEIGYAVYDPEDVFF